MTDALSPDQILSTGMGFWASKILLSAVELGVFTQLAQAPSPCEALSAPGTTSAQRPRFSRCPGGIEVPHPNRRLYGHWSHLTEALRTGQPQDEMKDGGEGPFEALYADPVRLRNFLATMTGVSRGAAVIIARIFPWAQYGTFADIGAAQGDLAVQIALAQPHLRGIGFDLP